MTDDIRSRLVQLVDDRPGPAKPLPDVTQVFRRSRRRQTIRRLGRRFCSCCNRRGRASRPLAGAAAQLRRERRKLRRSRHRPRCVQGADRIGRAPPGRSRVDRRTNASMTGDQPIALRRSSVSSSAMMVALHCRPIIMANCAITCRQAPPAGSVESRVMAGVDSQRGGPESITALVPSALMVSGSKRTSHQVAPAAA